LVTGQSLNQKDMSLNFLDKRIVGAIIIDAWQNHFSTEMDPADGQWFTNGPGNNGGLYGILTDSLASELKFLQNQQGLTINKIAAATGTADNRNGLTPEQTVTLTYSYQDSSSTSHSTTNALKVATGIDINAKTDFFGTGGGVTVKFSTEYSYSWTEGSSKSQSETKTFSQQVPIKNIPSGKVYQVTLLADKADIRVPFYADIILQGQSVANFPSPVNGQKTWMIDAGTLCEWINKYGSAGDESYKYMRDPDNPKQGLIRLQGNLTAAQTTNFTAMTNDITDSFKGNVQPALSRELAPADVEKLEAKAINQEVLS
jgi:hypothetical protein